MGQGTSSVATDQPATQEQQKNVEEVPLHLPRYFPTYRKECQDSAIQFFQCFSKNSVKKEKGDTTAGIEGLKVCKHQLVAYEKCMENK